MTAIICREERTGILMGKSNIHLGTGLAILLLNMKAV